MRETGAGASPFAYRSVATCDAEQHSHATTGLEHTYEQVRRGPFRGRVTELVLGPVHILRDQVDNPIAYRGVAWHGPLVFFTFLPTPGHTFCHGRPVDSNTVVKFPREYSHQAFCSGPIDCIAIAVDQQAMADRVDGLMDTAFSGDALTRSLCVVDPATVGRFQSCAAGILQTVAAEPALASNDAWRARSTDSVLQVLQDVIQMGAAVPTKLPRPTTRAYIVDKAVEYMHAHLTDPPVVAHVCREVRVCPRTLRYSFEEIVGVSPAHYLLMLRLRGVRRELLEGGGAASIHRIAQRYGFCQMSRFAVFYRQAFGELPSETCRRAEPVAPTRRPR